MNCSNCGACCLDETVPVRPAKGDVIAPEFIDSEGCLKKIDGHCVFLDPQTRKCTNYDNRPTLCRSLDAGCGRCHLSRLWAELDLDWFGKKPRLPADGSFERFYASVQHEGTTMRIVAIGGRTEQSVIDRFNVLVASAKEW